MNNFELGQLIVPNGILDAAFYYDPYKSELNEGIDYVVATDRERIIFDKHINNGIDQVSNLNTWIKGKNKIASEHHSARNKELNSFRIKMSQFKNRGKEAVPKEDQLKHNR